VTVLGEESEGWWKVELNGKKGIIPSNFVQEIGGSAQGGSPTVSSAGQDDDSTAPENKLKKIGVPMGGIGGLFTGGVPQLKKRVSFSLL